MIAITSFNLPLVKWPSVIDVVAVEAPNTVIIRKTAAVPYDESWPYECLITLLVKIPLDSIYHIRAYIEPFSTFYSPPPPKKKKKQISAIMTYHSKAEYIPLKKNSGKSGKYFEGIPLDMAFLGACSSSSLLELFPAAIPYHRKNSDVIS